MWLKPLSWEVEEILTARRELFKKSQVGVTVCPNCDKSFPKCECGKRQDNATN